MNDRIVTFGMKDLSSLSTTDQEQALTALESGKVVFFPHYSFLPRTEEHSVLSESILSPKRKNISYDYNRRLVSGLKDTSNSTSLMQSFMHRYAEFAKQLIVRVLPSYDRTLQWGRTSYRPAEIKGRKSSRLKDDTRLHVDSFPATPVNGLRILRVFCNINHFGASRQWHLGEPFPLVLQKFSSSLPVYKPWYARLLKQLRITKTLRSPYDHYMLNLHNKMKLDDDYQATVSKECIDFPAMSTWFVYTDQVSHAALSGQFLLEQTFYLPVTAMTNQETSPLRQMANLR